MHRDKARDDLEWNWSEKVLTKGEEKGNRRSLCFSGAFLCPGGGLPSVGPTTTLISELIPLSEYKAKNLMPANLCLD